MEAPSHKPSGFTLLELLVAAAVSSIVLLVVVSMFSASAEMLGQGQRHADVYSEGRSAMEFLRRDLEGCVTSKHRGSGVPSQGVKFATSESEAYGLFDERYFVPFEVNRIEGTVFEDLQLFGSSLERALMNAESDGAGNYHPYFDTLAFATRSNLERQVHTAIERGENAGASRNDDKRYRNTGEVCLAAYYVAYTYDSALENARASMKLFRHFRDSGSALTGLRNESVDTWDRHLQSRARSVLTKIAEPMAAQIDDDNLTNADLPYLLMPVDKYRGRVGTASQSFDAQHIWPVNYITLAEPPPSGMPTLRTRYQANWKDFILDDNYVWPDEPLAFNVVEFKCTPLRRDASGKYANASDLNATHGLAQGDEWPAALAPDVIEVKIRVISDSAASKFTQQSDWTGWKTIPYLRDIVLRESQVFHEQIYIGTADIGHER